MSEVPAFWSDPAIAGMMIAMGFVGTVGQVCLTKAFAAGDPAKVSVVGLSQVAFGVVFDVLIWQRTFTPLKIVGMSLIMAPTVWLLLRRRPAEPEASVL
jgi:drug/metabolite transporter (DMT)-like permease